MIFQKLSPYIATLLIPTILCTSARAGIAGHKRVVHQQISHRPMSPLDKHLAIMDLRISNLPINQKGIAVGATRLPNGQYWAFRSIKIADCEISDVRRTAGIHTDFIQVVGGGNWQDVPISLRVENIDMHDGVGIPLMIQDGNFDHISLTHLRVRNTTVSLQISSMHTGHIGTITIDDCPNMSIAIMGRPGAIGTVYIKNSPGLRTADVPNPAGRSGARFVYLN